MRIFVLGSQGHTIGHLGMATDINAGIKKLMQKQASGRLPAGLMQSMQTSIPVVPTTHATESRTEMKMQLAWCLKGKPATECQDRL